MKLSRRRFAIVGAGLVCAAAIGAGGEAFAKPAVPQRGEVDISHAVEAFRKAMVAGDGRKLMAMSSPNLRFGHSNGFVQSRSQFVQAVVTRKEIFRSIKLSQHRNTVVGNTAVARHVFAADILLEGKPLKVTLNCVEVWQKQAGQWKLLARQAYKPAKPV